MLFTETLQINLKLLSPIAQIDETIKSIGLLIEALGKRGLGGTGCPEYLLRQGFLGDPILKWVLMGVLLVYASNRHSSNHPGDPEPCRSDRRVQRRLACLGYARP